MCLRLFGLSNTLIWCVLPRSYTICIFNGDGLVWSLLVGLYAGEDMRNGLDFAIKMHFAIFFGLNNFFFCYFIDVKNRSNEHYKLYFMALCVLDSFPG